MPDCPIIDTHVHLWDPQKFSYPWLSEFDAINRRFDLDDYSRATRDVQIERIVFLECGVAQNSFHDEAAWITSLGASDSRIGAIVPFAPVDKGEAVRDDLAELVERNPLIKGVRRNLQGESDPAFAPRDNFVAGVQTLADFDLHFEMCEKGDDQLRSMVELARQCPDVKFILNHVGKPDLMNRCEFAWLDLMAELGSLPNTWCKISGVITEADHSNWQLDDIWSHVLNAIDVFSIDRVMFGGDWPVVNLAGSYQQWVDALDASLAKASSFTSSDRAKLYHDNAHAFYRLDC